MKILDTKLYMNDPVLVLNLFKKILYSKYKLYVKNASETKSVIQNMFSEEEIERAIKSITLDKNKNIVTNSDTRDDFILRYLEYGGEGVKPLHLISNSIRNLRRL